MRQGKMKPPDPSNLAKEHENLRHFKTRPHIQNMVAEATTLPEEYVSTEDNVSPSNDLTDAESFKSGQDQEQASVLGKRRKKRAMTLYPPPTSFDYRLNSSCQSLTDVRHQLCGDCWVI
uniref:Peptidase C1A papain C-terminal domain-containing protein n=1 Tax=Romanomermis culicivorax TaxID=13658 RepID=A0A915KYC7_ROMCU